MLRDIQEDLKSGSGSAGFVLNVGDFAITGCQQSQWLNNFFSPTRALFQQLPIFTTPGNHEFYAEEGGPECPDASFYYGYFGRLYAPGKILAPGVYSFDYKNARFISLNLTSDGDWGGAEKGTKEETHSPPTLNPDECNGVEQCGDGMICGYKWLQCRLLEANRNDSIDHVFVFYHAPMITAPPREKHRSSDFQIKTLAPLFERPDGVHPGKVTAVFSGHNHFYERSAPLSNLRLAEDAMSREQSQPAVCSKNTPSDFNFPPICYSEDPTRGVSYIISGGGGAALYNAPQPQQWLQSAHGAFCFTKITVDEKSAFLKTAGFYPDGVLFEDSAVLRKTP